LATCQNRVSQQEDQSNNVNIVSTPTKGFAVVVKNPLVHVGTYVGKYIGEVLSDNIAHQRILSTKNFEHNYLLLYNEHRCQSVTKTFVDARYYGNWTRFINHSCNPNLHVVPVRIDQPEPPHLAFFTLRTIEANEELSYSYGTEIDDKFSKPCHCQSELCTGFMPYQRAD
jgi:[histone H3]-lysine36 N-dimethyltransferase SETMAR